MNAPSPQPSAIYSARALSRIQTTLLALLLIFQSTAAIALDFRVDFRESTYQTQAGDTFSDLLAQHQSETLIQSSVTTGLENVSTTVYGNGVRRDYSILMSTTVEIGEEGFYEFQVGTDWGRGGAAALVDNSTGLVVSERVITDDVWWANSFDHEDVFTTSFNFSEGDSYSLFWVGFEDCCGGSSTIRFSVDGSEFAPLTETNFAPFTAVPEPSTAILVGLGLIALTGSRKRN